MTNVASKRRGVTNIHRPEVYSKSSEDPFIVSLALEQIDSGEELMARGNGTPGRREREEDNKHRREAMT